MSTAEQKAKHAAYQRKYRQQPGKRQIRAASEQKWRKTTENGRAYQALCAVRIRARKLGVMCDLQKEDLIPPKLCPVLGIALQRNCGGSGAADNSPSVDRINPAGGYTRDNVRIISQRANRIKNNCTDPRELVAVAEYVASAYSLEQLCEMAVSGG